MISPESPSYNAIKAFKIKQLIINPESFKKWMPADFVLTFSVDEEKC